MTMTSKYSPYTTSELNVLLNEAWEVSDQPYRLHAAFALSSLFDLLTVDDDEDDQPIEKESMWGQRVSKTIVDRLSKELSEDFNDAAETGSTIRVWGKPYSVRKRNAYDHNRLSQIFNFETDCDDYIIAPEGILKLEGEVCSELKKYETTAEQATANRNYLRQIVMLAEDDENDGWDKLTDMEVVLYCWAIFYIKTQTANIKLFRQKYKKHIYVSDAEIEQCYTEKSRISMKPTGLYGFSAERVWQWNKDHNQPSEAINIPIEEANDYWYERHVSKG